MPNDFGFNILGTAFSITVEEDEAYLQKVLSQYRAAVENTQNISGINDPLNVAILTGFLLCDEINKMKQQLENESIEVIERTMKLIAKLDHAFGVDNNGKNIQT
jgi:cell division protein ZapA (FtsZ GTPase activity inhibitor)